jgi:hypothetical protein
MRRKVIKKDIANEGVVSGYKWRRDDKIHQNKLLIL